jgi:hypothetical protein
MNVQDRIKKAHIAIMQHKVFCAYSGILACGKVHVNDDVPTAATNGWDVIYNPDFISQHMKTDPELRFLILHEAQHKAYRHLHVWQALHDEDAQLANIAADHFVNLSLVDSDAGEGFIKMPELGIQPDPKYRGWSVKQIFEDLKQEQEEGGEGGEGGGEEGGGGGEEGPEAGPVGGAVREETVAVPEFDGEVAGEVADAVVHDGEEGLALGADGWVDAEFQVDLASHVEEDEERAVEGDAGDHGWAVVGGEEEVAEDAEGEACDEEPFDAEAEEEAGDAEHGDASPVSITPAPVAAPAGLHYTCRETGSCATAQQLLRQGHADLDGNGNGIGCNSLKH